MHKGVKYALFTAAFLLVGYNSIYVKKLSEVKKATETSEFDALAYAKKFLNKTLPANKEKAISLAELTQLLKSNPRKAYSYSNAQNDGNIRYFMVKGEGEILKLDEDNAYLQVAGVAPKVLLATQYILGNAARDGSGLISVDEFTTTMEMNTVSEELNKLIKAEVLPRFKSDAKLGSKVSFIGSVQLNQAKAVPDSLEIIPLILNIVNH
ncbi:DUF2291 domain-containing protein [Pedobacter sp. SYSU D00535]|uniref:DUF2291 domain-containing protein n=1 Tax=Pedobacter sp. SYSU D00535 TaxID=2810308 RepID=UPI001A97CA5C|nr:DUF2291 domain-containing protein [Pedobacter sp. SYSU D00535]